MTESKGLGQSVESVLAFAKRLQLERKTRDSRQIFFIEGVRNFVQAVDHRYELTQIIFSKKLCTSALARKMVRQLNRQGVTIVYVTPEEFRSMSRSRRASGVAAIVRQRWTPLKDISVSEGGCWTVMESVYSRGNLGTLIRTSEAFGASGFILLGRSVDVFSPDIVRASMGGVFRQHFVRTDLLSLRKHLRAEGSYLIGASPDASQPASGFEYPKTSFIMLGEEREGLTAKQRDACEALVKIPMVGKADSLNLGVAGSLLIYEVMREQLV